MQGLLEVLGRLLVIKEGVWAAGLILASAIVVVAQDWQVSLLALLAEYVGVALILSRFLLTPLALLHALAGAIACIILYTAARRLPEGKMPVTRFAFRVPAFAMAGLAAYVLYSHYPLPYLSLQVNLASYWLAAVGFSHLIITEEPWRAGLGLLTLLLGFEVAYLSLDRGLVINGLFGTLHLLAALILAYLISTGQAEAGEGPEEGGL